MGEFQLERKVGRKRKASAILALPPVVHHMRQAEEFQHLLKTGEVGTRTELARRFRLTKARVTQLLDLLRLPEEVVAFVRSLPTGAPARQITERKLRALGRVSVGKQLALAKQVLPGFAERKSQPSAA